MRALCIVLGLALATEAIGLALGIAPVGPLLRDAVHAGDASVVRGTLLFAAAVFVLHAVLAAVVACAALLSRRVPWLAGIVAVGPIALAWFGFRAPFGFSVATHDIRLEGDLPLKLLEGAAVHIAFAAAACVIVLAALPFGLIHRRGAEGGRPTSNTESS